MAKQYYDIMIIGSVFQGLMFVLNGFTCVSGNVVLVLLITGSGAIINIVLDAIFVIGLDWFVQRVAFATVIGQVVSTLIGLLIIFGRKTILKPMNHYFKLSLPIVR